jgi:hypothetical protein
MNVIFIQMKTTILRGLAIGIILMIASFYNAATAQVDPSTAAKPDTTVQEKGKKENKEDKKRKDEFIVYGGVNFNNLGVPDGDIWESKMNIGYHLGFDYKRGKFFYWQVGARYNNAVYSLKDHSIQTPDADFVSVAVRGIDIPVTGGINFLSAINRIVALRLFVSAVPSFALGVGDNDLGYTKEDINSFILYGQGGIGVNVAFIVLEAGYNFGFQDLLKDGQSKPGQVFINLGFRF